MTDTARVACEADGCEAVAVSDIHFAGALCRYVCAEHRDELMALPNWTLYEIGGHPSLPNPTWTPGLTNRNGQRVALDGSELQQVGGRP